LSGSFKALLAVEGASATSRFDLRAAWVRLDGGPIVETAEDLAKGKLIAPIDVFASGEYDFHFNTVWAGGRGPADEGTPANTCASWTSNSQSSLASGGSTATIDFYWFGTGKVPCDVSCRVYCLQG